MESGYNNEEEEDEAMQELFDTINPKIPLSYKKLKECRKKLPIWEKQPTIELQYEVLKNCLNCQDSQS